MRYHCQYAWLGGATATPDVVIAVEDGRIRSVGAPGGDPATRLPGLTLPGLANAHSHQ